MKPNATMHMMPVIGEIFSLGATVPDDEKIVATSATPPLLAREAADRVTLISKLNRTCPPAEKIHSAEFAYDLEHLTKMQLRRKYVAEANAHRNMLTRSKQRGNVVHPTLREFRNFLWVVGPMPVSGATLDRIDNADREYAPGKVRWADKRTQNNNKGDTLTYHDRRTGEVFTTSRLAKLQGVTDSTIRKRLARGWDDAEIIAGARAPRHRQQQLSALPSIELAAPPRNSIRSERVRPPSAREIAFERMAQDIAHFREHHGVEEMLAPPEVFNEGLPEAWHITDEQWMARFEQLWPEYRPHIIFARADPYHQRAIELIDPEYVRREREKNAREQS